MAKTFDVNAAKAAGYSDAEIAEYVRKNALRADTTGPAPGTAVADATAQSPTGIGGGSAWADFTRKAAPFVGATVPSLVFPQASVPLMAARAGVGAVLAGGVGDVVGEYGGGTPQDESNAAQLGRAGGRFAMGAGSEVGGQAISRGLRWAGEGLLDAAFWPSKALKKDFRKATMTGGEGAADRATVGKIAAAERAPVGALRGDVVSDRVLATVEANGEKLRQRLSMPQNSQQTFTTNDLRAEFGPLLSRAAKDPMDETAEQQIRQMLQILEDKYGGRNLTPLDLLEIKQMADVGGVAAHRKVAQGGLAASSPVAAEAYKTLADAARKILNNLGDPKIRALNQETQRLLFLAKAAIDAEARTSGVVRHAWAPALAGTAVGAGTYGQTRDAGKGAAAGLGFAALTDPITASRLGLAMTGRANNPALAGSLLRALGFGMGGGEDW